MSLRTRLFLTVLTTLPFAACKTPSRPEATDAVRAFAARYTITLSQTKSDVDRGVALLQQDRGAEAEVAFTTAIERVDQWKRKFREVTEEPKLAHLFLDLDCLRGLGLYSRSLIHLANQDGARMSGDLVAVLAAYDQMASMVARIQRVQPAADAVREAETMLGHMQRLAGSSHALLAGGCRAGGDLALADRHERQARAMLPEAEVLAVLGLFERADTGAQHGLAGMARQFRIVQ